MSELATRTSERDGQIKVQASRDIQTDKQGGVGTPRVAGTTIGFTGSTITDSGSGFTEAAGFAAERMVEVRGSASNDGRYYVTGRADGELTVERAVTTEAAGAAVKVRQI